MRMNMWMFLVVLFMLTGSTHAQENHEEQISEEQILLNGYIDTSGKVLLTGYATQASLSSLMFLEGMKYTFDNNTNQLYAVTDMLTSKSADTWSFNLSLDGYFSDCLLTLYLPEGSEITRFEINPELSYQFQVREDSLTLNIQGYRVISPWIRVNYKLPAPVPEPENDLVISISLPLVMVLIAGAVFAFYRYRAQKGAALPHKQESLNQETKTVPESKEIRITDKMQKVIDTLSDKEKSIVGLLLRYGGSATQAAIRHETGIPRSSLTGIVNALKRKNIIKKHEYGRTNVIELSEWFLS